MQLLNTYTITKNDIISDNIYLAKILSEIHDINDDCTEYATSHIYDTIGVLYHGDTISYDDSKTDCEIIPELLSTTAPEYLAHHMPEIPLRDAYLFIMRNGTTHILHFTYS